MKKHILTLNISLTPYLVNTQATGNDLRSRNGGDL
jgi:hypothetical protein